MDLKPVKLEKMIEEIDAIISNAKNSEKQFKPFIDKVHPEFKKSALNLAQYRAVRSMDIRELQYKLGNLNISRLARAEAHIMSSLHDLRYILQSLLKKEEPKLKKGTISNKKAQKLLHSHTKDLFGYRSEGRRVRIMVTLPSEAAYNFNMVESMVLKGMNCARINCAHDGPEQWLQMIEHVKKASTLHKRNVKITMDLAGPKIRTGTMTEGPKVKKFRPLRDKLGKVVTPAEIEMVPLNSLLTPKQIPVPQEWIDQINEGDVIRLVDAREKKRKLKVVRKESQKITTTSLNTAYIASGMKLAVESFATEATVGDMPALEEYINLRTGDLLTVHLDGRDGQPALTDETGAQIAPGSISCTLPEVFYFVKPGERILFDDGKIEGIIKTVKSDEFTVKVTQAGPFGAKLRADKGINFPDTDLRISGLTQKDKKDLEFVTRHADVVNFSFVNSPDDVEELLEAIEQLGGLHKLGVILKIETQKSFYNLTEILLTVMRAQPVGVMIARGDLAIETGWDRMAMIQNEILALCYAAHIPVIWATQVLDNLAKRGIPSRSEITDVATSLKAECVMLNKGPFINEAISLLDTILQGMEIYQEKNIHMLPMLEAMSH